MKDIFITLIITVGVVIGLNHLWAAAVESDRLDACGKRGVTCTIVTHVVED